MSPILYGRYRLAFKRRAECTLVVYSSNYLRIIKTENSDGLMGSSDDFYLNGDLRNTIVGLVSVFL